MPELPRISGDEAIKVFKELGFYAARQRGSHVVLRREDKGCVIPRHKQLYSNQMLSSATAGLQKGKVVKDKILNRLDITCFQKLFTYLAALPQFGSTY
ncbi:MAG: type II toxin-antitoxin system HicA family toxin [Thermodesulfobacteriota bacterium]|nr:type II toxin-antitoxin system HicA family toxin [Thermodesulfobacteriota bacterium]